MDSGNYQEPAHAFPRRTVLGLAGFGALAVAGCTPGTDQAAPPTTVSTSPTLPPTSPAPSPTASAEEAPASSFLLATLAHSDKLARINPDNEDPSAVETVTVGAAPWGVAVDSPGNTAYVATAEGLAVVDLVKFTRTKLVPYQHPAPSIGQGEYRAGGLGVAVSPDGSEVYVAVLTDVETTHLEVFNVRDGVFGGSVQVGWRPFDVVVAPDGKWVASIDHDSFTVTVVDPAAMTAQRHEIAPFGTEGGLGSWEKIHYGAVDSDGTILLPVQGKVVVRFNPATGESTTLPSTANSHAHGTVLAGRRLLTVGTGPFGNATGGPNLSVLDLATGAERLAPLNVPHETVASFTAVSGEEWAAVAGGNTRDEGWDGLTFIRLSDFHQRTLAVPGYPQVVVAYPRRGA